MNAYYIQAEDGAFYVFFFAGAWMSYAVKTEEAARREVAHINATALGVL